MYIFGYGSLVNIQSAQKSFTRKLIPSDFIPIRALGVEKIWNAIEHITFENESASTNGVFLNLKKKETSHTNGVLLKITPEEFEFLKIREKNYSCIEITSIEGFETTEPIYTFMTTNEEKIAHKTSSNCVIPQRYINLLEDGAKMYSKEFQVEFKNSYSHYPFDIKAGTYKFSDPIQNKFAKEGHMREE